MEDGELRARLDSLARQVEETKEETQELRDMLTAMSIADADARADAKLVVSKLEVSTQAMASAAQALHALVLVGKTVTQKPGGFERKVILALLGIITTLVAALVALKLTGHV